MRCLQAANHPKKLLTIKFYTYIIGGVYGGGWRRGQDEIWVFRQRLLYVCQTKPFPKLGLKC